MGTFLFSNQKLNSEAVSDVFMSQAHKNVYQVDSNDFTLIYSNKIFINNTNFVEFSNANGDKDFILGIGTFCYKGLAGEEALRMIYDDFSDTFVLKDNLIYGHFAFVVCKRGYTYVFNDMSGTLRLYCTSLNDKIVVSSSQVAIMSILKNKKIDKAKMSLFISAEYAREIPFLSGLDDFNPIKLLKINNKDGKEQFLDKYISIPKRVEKMEDATELVESLFDEQIRNISPLLNETVSMELSGGLDSRLVSAVLRKYKVDYEYVHFPIFGPDKEVGDIISKKLNKKVHLITPSPLTKDFNEKYGEFDFGFNFFRNYPNSRWQIPNKSQFTGFFGECLTLPEIYDRDVSRMKRCKLYTLLSELTSNKLIDSKITSKALTYLTEVFVSLGFDKDTLMSEYEQQEFTRIISERLTGDAMFISAACGLMNYYSIYNEWHFVHNVANISFDVIKQRKLTLELIKRYDKELADLPFVSRRRTRVESISSISELPLQYKSYVSLKQRLPDWMVNLGYRLIGRVISKEYIDYIDFSYYQDIIDVKKLQRYPNLYWDMLQRMYSVEVLRKRFNIN